VRTQARRNPHTTSKRASEGPRKFLAPATSVSSRICPHAPCQSCAPCNVPQDLASFDGEPERKRQRQIQPLRRAVDKLDLAQARLIRKLESRRPSNRQRTRGARHSRRTPHRG